MIFISLMQSKNVPPAQKEVPTKVSKVAAKPVVKTSPVLSISAQFKFYPTASNPSIPSGSYQMQGTYNKDTGELRLGGVQWIDRPAGYDMVPLSGVINLARHEFSGSIEFQDCEKFVLKRQGAGNDYKGSWQGSYFCFQGETGLTLELY
jgi:hypothetical protein